MEHQRKYTQRGKDGNPVKEPYAAGKPSFSFEAL